MSSKKEILENNFTVEPQTEDRLDRYLALRFDGYSRTYFKKLINKGIILVDQHRISPDHDLKPGQQITITWPEKKTTLAGSEQAPLPFPLIYEDEHMLVLNKPAGLLCHPTGAGKEEITLVDLLAPKTSIDEWPDDVRPGLVHRLDRDTSGVLLYAKTPQVQGQLSKQFALRKVKKVYRALVVGKMKDKEGTLECSIARHPQHRLKFAVSAEGRLAITNFLVKESWGTVASHVELYPLTGRTHQLRVQLSGYGHPILGDHLYEGRKKGFELITRQMLHAFKIEFLHPVLQKKMVFEADLPIDFQDAIKLIRSLS